MSEWWREASMEIGPQCIRPLASWIGLVGVRAQIKNTTDPRGNIREPMTNMSDKIICSNFFDCPPVRLYDSSLYYIVAYIIRFVS